VIITRTPLRISLGGGGTDLPSYYRVAGRGFLVAAAIDRHVYIAVNRNFDDDLMLKYSSIERVGDPTRVDHPLLREALLVAGVHRAVEISSMADVPAGTGLGSSGSFTVGVLRALFSYRRHTISARQLADLACEIEMERLGAPVGKQDPYIAAIGGVTGFAFRSDGEVDIHPIAMSDDVRNQLEDNLLLFFTGVRRSAAAELSEQGTGSASTGDIKSNLDAVRELGEASMEVLEKGDLAGFSQLMTAQWQRKLERSPTSVHRQVDEWIRRGLDCGAKGGKLVGAGGGGFLLFYVETKERLRSAMRELGLEEVRFGFDYDGATTIVS
jgi:D-glycero-alpha-D-manno-heptose-7-phosphate kinase